VPAPRPRSQRSFWPKRPTEPPRGVRFGSFRSICDGSHPCHGQAKGLQLASARLSSHTHSRHKIVIFVFGLHTCTKGSVPSPEMTPERRTTMPHDILDSDLSPPCRNCECLLVHPSLSLVLAARHQRCWWWHQANQRGAIVTSTILWRVTRTTQPSLSRQECHQAVLSTSAAGDICIHRHLFPSFRQEDVFPVDQWPETQGRGVPAGEAHWGREVSHLGRDRMGAHCRSVRWGLIVGGRCAAISVGDRAIKS